MAYKSEMGLPGFRRLFHACTKGNSIYFFVYHLPPFGNQKASKIEVLDIEKRSIDCLPPVFDGTSWSTNLTITENLLVFYTSGTVWWIDLQKGYRTFKVETDFEILHAAACEGRILLIGALDNAVNLYWHDPVKNETTLALKNPLSVAYCENGILPMEYDSEEWDDNLTIIDVRRVTDQLFLLFKSSDDDDTWQYLCKMDFSESNRSLQIIDTGAEDGDEFRFTGDYIVKYCKAEDDDTDEYRAFAILNFDTLAWMEIPHSNGDRYSLYGDYLYKDEKYRTKLFSNYLWEKT